MKLFHLAPLAALALTLASCGEAAGPTNEQASKAEKSGGFTIADGKLVLPAVVGNPGAAYFSITNGTKEPASLAAVSISGATKAEMHETSGNSMAPLTTLTLGPGATAPFEPGGKHVMVFGVPRALKPGDSVKVTLTFMGGKTAAAPLQVESASGGHDH